MKKIGIVLGARPQFIKHAPVEKALNEFFEVFSIHTGQHYDEEMSDVFFSQLGMKIPRYNLRIGSGGHGKQTGAMMMKLEEVLLDEKPDAILVYGDTNSTLAGALVASKLGIKLIHVEAGLRSFNRDMPEEINRVLTDHISDILFAPTDLAVKNLQNESITTGVCQVGDVMCDSVLMAKEQTGKIFSNGKEKILLTLHRPYNTDDKTRLLKILKSLNSLDTEVVFPIHPRTLNVLKKYAIELESFPRITFIPPQSYFDLVKLQLESTCIITDSGGIQKEAYLLKTKCITIRTETEWTETLQNGWNTLVYEALDELPVLIRQLPGTYIEGLYGDGRASQRIAKYLLKELE